MIHMINVYFLYADSKACENHTKDQCKLKESMFLCHVSTFGQDDLCNDNKEWSNNLELVLNILPLANPGRPNLITG